MNLRELSQRVALGEGRFQEFKRRVPQPARIAKEVVALANTVGGTVFLGVDDDGTIVGLRDAEEEEYALHDALETHCTPPIRLRIERVSISRKRDVIVVYVPDSDVKPHYVEHEGKRTAYIRVDEVSREASREAIRLMRTKGRGDGVRFEFGDKEMLLMRYLDQYGRITVETFAKIANIAKKRASHTLVLLTRAHVLELHSTEDGDFFTAAAK
ncbi:MAG: ATP-binding protein [Rhodothermales bacterium]